MTPASPSARVLVTGGSGYLAGALIRVLAAQGWQVHTTMRSLQGEAVLRQRLGVAPAQWRCFAARLEHDEGWAEAAAGCSHVAHLASPLPAGVPRHADELIVPARDGALRVLRAAREAGVRRVVMTSSVAAIAYGRGRGEHHFTERDWTDLAQPGISAYAQSKTLAECAARSWVAADGGALELCTINPSVVLGPVDGAQHSASVMVVRKLLDGSLRACPDIGFGLVDLRDVAELHARALTAPGLAGERFIASGRFMKLIEIAAVLRQCLGPAAHRVPTRTLPDAVLRLAGWFHPVARAVVPELGAVRHLDASHAQAVLGWRTRPVEQSIEDCARSLIAHGLVRA